MKRDRAETLALILMREYGLLARGWNFGWMRATKTLGRCYYLRQEIKLSQSFVDLNEEDKVEETIRHEIAHALVGMGHGHGEEWKSTAYMVGCKDPKARCTDDDLKMAEGRYVAECGECGHRYSRHRPTKPGARFSCSRHGGPRVYNSAYHLTFIDTRASLAPTAVVRASLSAAHTVAGVDVQASASVSRVGATELSAAMKVSAKSLRAWLRRRPDLQAKYQNAAGQYEFDANAVSEIVREWNASH